MVQNVFVLLLGFPGVGKLTIARELGAALPARVIDNHWINNPILALLADDGLGKLPDAVWEQTAKVRQAILDTIATLCAPAANFIFTNSGIQEDARSLASYEQLKDASDRRRALFVPVRLLCDEDELVRRVTSPTRRDRLKSIDPEAARRRSRMASVLDPKHPNSLTVDVTAISVEEATKKIHEHVKGLVALSVSDTIVP
ncbi:chloramphenicol phosphotransferase [Mesorhizobium sp. B2-7-2]|uniref:chloramphenicol phosphotransferase n=1 Tax=Mesorhizobium sp. B2-7-2 TaxID=2589908 RepID=UPI00112706D2|nr:chloramphenicol phosphotransferase [Mesorhizobium sp. B2-7-2]TPJ31405.1 chloramphenicol phosphotransferase [Mesorhizobium sp. B2-7-2]